MILKSLKMNNFRIYKGEVTINFASGDKNITIIQGNNEVGKTTIMNAITWCLYNKEYYKLEGKKPKWNSFVADELETGEEDFVEVSLIMEDESKNIVTFKRVLNFFKNDKGNVIKGTSSFEITEDDGKNTNQFLSTETYLNKHLPLKLRKYFLFNGEQLENFFNLGKSGNITDSVDQLSQLNLLKRLVKHLGSIENTHISRGDKLAPKLTKIRKDIKKQEELCKNNSDKKIQLEKDKKEYSDEIIDLENQISSIKGESSIGKSETALELIQKGHRLVADDAVEIKRIDDGYLVGQSPELLRHFMEIRGIGIIDVRSLYGVGAVKNSKKIDLVIHLEGWDETKYYDRLGLDKEYESILGEKIERLVVPVKPGRNTAMVIEVAAMNFRQKGMGYDAAQEFTKKLSKLIDKR